MLCLGVEESSAVYYGFDILHIRRGQSRCIGIRSEQHMSHLIDGLVSRLCAQNDGNEELKWVALIQETDVLWILRIKNIVGFVQQKIILRHKSTLPFLTQCSQLHILNKRSGALPSGYGACFGSRISEVRVLSPRKKNLQRKLWVFVFIGRIRGSTRAIAKRSGRAAFAARRSAGVLPGTPQGRVLSPRKKNLQRKLWVFVFIGRIRGSTRLFKSELNTQASLFPLFF